MGVFVTDDRLVCNEKYSISGPLTAQSIVLVSYLTYNTEQRIQMHVI